MAKFVLKPFYSDGSVVILGSSCKSIKKALKKHWENIYEDEPECDYVKKINAFLEKDHKSVYEIQEEFMNHFNEEYFFEEAD